MVTAAHAASFIDIATTRHLSEQAVEVARRLGDDRLLIDALAALCAAAAERSPGQQIVRSVAASGGEQPAA
jgi:hypothetical protein